MKKLERLFSDGVRPLEKEQTGKIFGGLAERTFTICKTDTNDPGYACGDTYVKCTDDEGVVYHERTEAKECIVT